VAQTGIGNVLNMAFYKIILIFSKIFEKERTIL